MRAGLAALFVSSALASEPPEAADALAPTVEVDWHAPPDCGVGDDLVARIEVLLGRPLGQPGDPDLAVDGRVETEADGLVLVLEFRQPIARVRELRGRTCAELREAAAVVLAVTVDPLVPLDEAPEPEPEAVPELEPEPEPEPLIPASPPQLGVRLRVAGGIQYGALPAVAGGPSLAVGLRWRSLRAELVGAWWLSKAALFESVPEVGATISLGWIAPRVCGVPSTPRVSFPLCAGVELGGMRASAFGVPGPRTHTSPWVAAELGGAVTFGLGGAPLALWLGVDGVIPLVRPGFTIAGLGELHRVPPFAFQVLLGFEVRLAGRPTDPGLSGQGGGA